jgi:prevent-host-death family protein
MASRVILGIQDFRLRLKERFDALEQGEETILQRRGRPIGALVPMDDYRKIRELRGDPTDL